MSKLPTATAVQIAHYYDKNTRRFLRFGGSGETAAIHRQIWAPGVHTTDDAFLYLNRLVARTIQPALSAGKSPLRLLDLGCGVGGTATWLAQELGVQVYGVTNSAAQHQIATQRARKLGLSHLCQFALADFNQLPYTDRFQAAFAIESFVHAGDADAFFTMAGQQITGGGKLVICDDFLHPANPPQAHKWVQRFIKGWHLNNLQTLESTLHAAAQAGFYLAEQNDLSASLRSFHPIVLWLVILLTQLPLKSTYWQNLAGGSALQVCVRNGWTKYLALVFEKSTP